MRASWVPALFCVNIVSNPLTAEVSHKVIDSKISCYMVHKQMYWNLKSVK